MKKIQGLDALRAIAVFLVILTHWGPYQFRTSVILTFIFQKIIPSGAVGVDFFFVLSGFLITSILLRSKQDAPNCGRFKALRVFIIRRCLRIFPVYYIFLFFLFVINYPDIRHYFVFFATYTSNYLSIIKLSWNAFSHTWTLSVEEQFYVIWPFVILFCPYNHLLKVILIFIIAGTAANVLTTPIYGFYAYIITFNCFNAFAIGGLYSYALIENKSGILIKKGFLWLLPFALVLYVLAMCHIDVLPVRLIHAILSINVIMYVTEKRYGTVVGMILNNKILNHIGKISYGIYLFHYTIPHFYNALVANFDPKSHMGLELNVILHIPIVAELIQFMFLIAVSYLSFYLIETRFLRLKKYFEYKRPVPMAV